MISLDTLIGSIELGLIYGVMALGVFLSFRTLDMPDLTVDGSIVTGAAISAVVTMNFGNPILGLILAFLLGGIAGVVTAVLNTKLNIQPLLAGILVMLGLYSINIRIMGNVPNISLSNEITIYDYFDLPYYQLILGIIIILIIVTLLYMFLKTRLGVALRATGDNKDMVRASGYSSDYLVILGMAISNGLVGLAGGMLGQYQSFADANMGTGMVVIGLASVIIGEVIFGIKTLGRRLIAVVLGAIVYRIIIAIALNLGMAANDLKLISSIIVIVALSMGVLSKKVGVKHA